MNIVDYLNELSDTELRVVLVVTHVRTPMSVADIQEMAGRKRQVYTAIKDLRKRGIISQHNGRVVDDKVTKWDWSCIWDAQPEVVVEPTVVKPVIVVNEVLPIEVPLAEPKKAKEKSPRPSKGNPNQQHPAVLAYVEVSSRRPKQFVANAIAETVANEGDDLDAWKNIVKSWIMNGWNPINVDGMLNMYRNRNQPSESNRQKRRIVLTDLPQPSMETQAAKLEEYLREHEE